LKRKLTLHIKDNTDLNSKINSLLCTLLLLFGLASSSALAQTKATAIKDFADIPATELMAISPSGERLAYRKTDTQGDRIVIMSVSDNKIIKMLSAEEIEPNKLYFVNDNELIMHVSRFYRPEDVISEIRFGSAYVYNIKKERLTILMKPGDFIYRFQDMDKIKGLSPDGKALFMSAYAGNKLSSGDKERPKNALFKVRLSKARRPNYIAYGSQDTIDYFVDGKGEPLVDERYNDRDDTHTVLVKQDDEWREIYSKVDKIRTIDILGIMPDYQSLAVLKYNDTTDQLAVYLMSLKDGTLILSDLSHPDFDIDRMIIDINQVVEGVAYSGFTRSYKFIDKTLDKRIASILENFPDHTVWLQSRSPDWKHIIVYAEGPNAPGDFYLFTHGTAPKFIATARPNIAPEAIQPIAEVTFTARDGLKIPTLLTIPQQHVSSLKNLPTVILPHGGPESFDRISYDWLAQAIASQGYLVVQPQFRGSFGFGLTHKQAGHGQWGKGMQDDLSDSLTFLQEKGITDPAKVCILGASYGGYAALAGGAFTPDLFKCVISINGVSDVERMISSKEYYLGSDHWVVSYWEKLIANGEADDEFLEAISPLNFAKNFTAPTLLIHAQNDRIVRSYQSEKMASELDSQDKVVKYVELENESHSLHTSEGRFEALSEIIGFLNTHIGK
jgi:dipeptidyl aminopeptidase/acylaminoacyl peptidase